ncbi:MAG: hypothetical protein OXN15_00820, partial [Chloroflexota bacterium]|nr:hypothetical protein [Chloroflexota bacterium]
FGAEGLCLDLLHADTEEEVIVILRQKGYWDDPTVWEPFGGTEGNFSTFGNQSRTPEAALVEKVVNSVDAVLTNECWLTGIRPDSEEAPKSIAEAVARFFYGEGSITQRMGDLAKWDDSRRREVANRITLAATGSRKNLSLTIVDSGEGQSPNGMPGTLLSLDRRNKINVHFVQGKFNMGGTGALRFCGRNNLQLIVSRRNPDIPRTQRDSSIDEWGFTIVRRQNPGDGSRASMYTYLAPLSEGVLRFSADTLPLFPQGNQPYVRQTAWGTAIKLYEYKLAGKSHILLGDGLLQRLDLLLPRIALPIRLHECRDYRGRPGSFDTTLLGLGVRLSDDRNESLEEGFPTSFTCSINGETLTAEIYAFKRDKARSYKRGEGIIFTVNGQTHGDLPQHFFARRGVRLDRLRQDILVIVDCSGLSTRSREDLFMNSRDRLEQGELLDAIQEELQSSLREHAGLRSLRERRRSEESEARLSDSRPLQETLQDVIQRVPALARLFGNTGPLPDPFRRVESDGAKKFVGRPHPTFFRFQRMKAGEALQRTTAINMRSRIVFETDVENGYFARTENPGERTLRFSAKSRGNDVVPNFTLNLDDGVATLNLSLPEGARVGDSYEYELTVKDPTLIDPFTNCFKVNVGPFQPPSGSGGGRRNGRERGSDPGVALRGLAIPTPYPVYEKEWDRHGFDRYSALKVYDDSAEANGDEGGSYSYYINMDNVYLLTELKATRSNPDVLKKQWQVGMVLVGMALFRDLMDVHDTIDAVPETIPQDEVSKATAAIAPVLLPLIGHLGALADEDPSPED